MCGGDGEAELPEVITPQTLGRIWASSMGLSFAVRVRRRRARRRCRVGRLRQPGGRGRRRQEAAGSGPASRSAIDREIRLDGEPLLGFPLTGEDPDAPGVLLAVDVRPATACGSSGSRSSTPSRSSERPADTAWLFQSRLTVTALDGATAIFAADRRPRSTGAWTRSGRPEEAHLRLLYRNQRRYAAGRNVAVHPHGPRRRAWLRMELTTTWLPAYDVPATIRPAGLAPR